MSLWRVVAAIALPLLIVSDGGRGIRIKGPAPKLSAVATLGRRIFFDSALSASGKMSCASCHSPSHAYGPPNDDAVQRGGGDLNRFGLRAVPTLRYHEFTPSFSIGPTEATADNDNDLAVLPLANPNVARVAAAPKSAAGARAGDNTPQGGLDWDGRADTFQDQASGPFLDPNEMANRDSKELLEKLRRAPYANDFMMLFGPRVFDQPDLALNEALFALTRFQIEDPSFHPYNSRFDLYRTGAAALTPQELRGLALFEDPKKGNCSSCHVSRPSLDGRFPPAFTDYEFAALGAPRNMEIPANRDPQYFDSGLCGPIRTDYTETHAYCGLFKTPTLRNIAMRRVFFHNGVFHSLEDTLRFYVERETKPENWYPRTSNGQIDKYNDLPPRYRANVDIVDAPFDRKEGERPALSSAEIADIIAFLKTLNDSDAEGELH